ncbi:MAG: hypothetical protein GY828_03560 [Candidatus Gracilibacteria bacterium]|nr:hypothetical protein [Candidatus Gracilibacteria bacterium]
MESGYVKIKKEDYDDLLIEQEHYNTLKYGGAIIKESVYSYEKGAYEEISYIVDKDSAIDKISKSYKREKKGSLQELDERNAKIEKLLEEKDSLEKKLIESIKNEKKCILF